MILNLDAFVGILCIVIAFCFASIFVFSSRAASKWPTIPEYVRYGLGVVSLMFLWRGANLLDLSYSPESVPGRANVEAAMATIGLTYLAIAASIWFSTSVMADKSWEKISWVRGLMRRDPRKAPIMVDPVELAHASGLYAIGPGEGAEAAVREARRMPPQRHD